MRRTLLEPQLEMFFAPFSRFSRRIQLDNSSLNSGLFSYFLTLPIVDYKIEIPTFAIKALESFIKSTKFMATDKVVIPLCPSNAIMINNIRSIERLIHNFNGYSEFIGELRGIKTSKGEIYFGTRGIVLDKDFKILWLNTVEVDVSPRIIAAKPIEISKSFCYVSQDIFLRSTEMVPKALIQKIIPYYLQNKTREIYISSGCVADLETELRIENMSNRLSGVEQPNVATFSNQELNQCGVDNLDTLKSICTQRIL
jgi:hypothetical protein